ncbi:LPXTG cell wall anchor domain-containing protein [Streptomyces sp. G2]|uniref:LPXTG cell wall anchor domain-containing protein n=1 Tax=Streptomyces TaxID=1883 RepID=UPI00202FADA7|nr:LPXTG cell wall anchor domain-containing protein [Streptomyces sp. G2]MCM1945334.1 LPXTG cell wall anchor domain-containing protein [Streptomyces sp. G2]
MRRSLIPAATLVAAMAGSLILAGPASATGGKTYELPLHQDTPIAAADFQQGECPDTIPADKDGWHFVIPGGGVDFVKLTVTFDGGAPVEITSFGPPKDDHAYVASEAGAKLTSAVAIVDGEVKQGFFNLSHTCAATGGSTGGTATGETTGETTTGETTTGETTTGETTTGETTTGETTTGETTTGETTTGETTATGETTTGETTGESTATGETTATGGSSATGETTTGETTSGGSTTGGTATGEATTGGTDVKGGSEEGNLAETGAGAPIGAMAGVAAALAAAGAFLVMRRRKAAQN